jgi:hypothetical protein|eukprot:COSAG06_NODE_952_length_11333_cov_2.718355_2_plen_66_part_00
MADAQQPAAQSPSLFGSVAAIGDGVSGMFAGVSSLFPALAPETLEVPWVRAQPPPRFAAGRRQPH